MRRAEIMIGVRLGMMIRRGDGRVLLRRPKRGKILYYNNKFIIYNPGVIT